MNKSQSIILWSLILVGLAVIALVMLAIFKPGPVVDLSSLREPVTDSDWVKGDKNAPVVLVEYSDFECPACAYYATGFLKQLEQEFGNKVTFVYRHFPLPQHKNAKLAAQTAEAAGKQGKFWEMHDLIFKLQHEWTTSPDPRQNFIAYAQMLNLDMAKFNQDVNAQDAAEKIEKHLEWGSRQNLQATPTFFINGKFIEPPKTYDEFKTIINQVISEKGQ